MISEFRTLRRYRISASSFYFIQGLAFSTWTSRIPDIKSALSLSDGDLGLLLLSLPAGQLLAMPISGYLVNRFGSCSMLRVAGLLLPLLLLPLGLMPSMLTLVPALLLFGMMSNLSNISVCTQCVGVERLYGKSIMVAFHGMWSLAGLIAISLSMLFVSVGISPFWNFVIIFVFAFLLYSLNFLALLPRDKKPSSSMQREDLSLKRRFPVNAFILSLGFIGFGCLFCEGAMYNWSAVYFERMICPGTGWERLGYASYMLAVTGFRFSADIFVRRIGAYHMISLAGIFILTGTLLLTIFPSLWVSSAGCFIIGLGTAVIIPLVMSLAGNSNKVPAPLAVASASTIAYLGFLSAPPAVGFISGILDLRWALALVGGLAFLATLLVRGLRRRAHTA